MTTTFTPIRATQAQIAQANLLARWLDLPERLDNSAGYLEAKERLETLWQRFVASKALGGPEHGGKR